MTNFRAVTTLGSSGVPEGFVDFSGLDTLRKLNDSDHVDGVDGFEIYQTAPRVR